VSALDRVVIVGAGAAGHHCALELRACGFAGQILLVGPERHGPYDRTLLSKDFLEGEVDSDSLALAHLGEYEAKGIELRLETEVVGLLPRTREVALANGSLVDYDRLVIATGGVPARPRALAGSAGRVLRGLNDAAELREELVRARHLIVIGAGFVGGEVAASALALGLTVTMIEALPTPLARAVGAEVGERIADLHRGRGVELVTGTAVTAIVKGDDDAGVVVTLSNGRELSGDVALIAAGMRPAVQWLVGSKVDIDGGVVTDELCRTTAPDVFAAGDCASWWHPRMKARVRIEHWDTAAQHGTAAAQSVLGDGQPFAPVPFFWSTQHGIRLQAVGHVDAWDAVEIDDSKGKDSFVARYYRDGRLIAGFAAGDPHAIAEARRELESSRRARV
jgi:3-phenylpropionate/trans-cinnamate dioxygenase ferredoxin reductase subunit